MNKLKKEYHFIAVLLICFVFLTIFVVLGRTNLIDEAFYNGVTNFENDTTTKVLYIITNLASTIGIIVLIVLTGIIFWKNKSISDFKYVVLNVGIGALVVQILKLVIKRSRPIWKWIVQDGFSYPSGHTITSFLFYGTLILLVYKKVNNKWKKPLIFMLLTMIILTGFSRIYFGAHYLTDVVASLILGSIILIISNMFMNKEYNNDKNKDGKTIQAK